MAGGHIILVVDWIIKSGPIAWTLTKNEYGQFRSHADFKGEVCLDGVIIYIYHLSFLLLLNSDVCESEASSSAEFFCWRS